MALFDLMYLANFMLETGTAMYENKLQSEQVAAKNQNIAANNRDVAAQIEMTNVITKGRHVGIANEWAAVVKRNSLDLHDLQMYSRRKMAEQAAAMASSGGAFGSQGNTANQVLDNIERYRSNAYVRKINNAKTDNIDYMTKHLVTELTGMSQINQLHGYFSALEPMPDFAGTGLQIASSAIRNYVGSQRGTTGGRES